MKTYLYILMLCCGLLTGCDHKELCYLHPHDRQLRVQFDWSLIEQKDIPQVVKLICSPLWLDDKDRYLEFDLPPEGGTVNLPEGNYELMAYNNDSHVNLVDQKNMTMPGDYAYRHWRFILTTPNSRTLPNNKQAPDFFCLAVKHENMGGTDSREVIVMRPQRRTARVKCEVRGIGNLEQTRKIYGVLTGCADYMDLSSGICLERITQGNKSSVAFEMDNEGGVIRGRFCLLGSGFPPGSKGTSVEHRHKLQIYLLQKNGKLRKFEGDVTEQVPCDNPIGVTMADFDISLELTAEMPDTEDEKEEGMFDPDVDEWEDVETVLPLNRNGGREPWRGN